MATVHDSTPIIQGTFECEAPAYDRIAIVEVPRWYDTPGQYRYRITAYSGALAVRTDSMSSLMDARCIASMWAWLCPVEITEDLVDVIEDPDPMADFVADREDRNPEPPAMPWYEVDGSELY